MKYLSFGQLCEVVKTMNARWIESEQVLEARFVSLENGVGSNRAAKSGAAASGLFQTVLEPDHPMPGRIMVNLTAIRPDEVVRRFEGALRVVSQEGDAKFRSLQATWAHLVQTLNATDFLLGDSMGAGIVGRARDVLVELYNPLPRKKNAPSTELLGCGREAILRWWLPEGPPSSVQRSDRGEGGVSGSIRSTIQGRCTGTS